MWRLCVRLFFFFKQKTAYEMRISDWSSDVCSSDLWLDENPASLREDYSETLMLWAMSCSPERAFACRQIREFVDDAIDQLPVQFRTVFVLRQIEELDVGEVAETLGINVATVKTRHMRAKRRLQRALASKLGKALADILPFTSEAHERSASRAPRTVMRRDWPGTQVGAS